MNFEHKYTSAIIAAAGSGQRMNSKIPKQFLPLQGVPILVRTLAVFDKASEIDEVIIVSAEENTEYIKSLICEYSIKKVKKVVCGGATRQKSIKCGLEHIDGELVLIHDGVRPFVTEAEINSVAEQLYTYDAAAIGVFEKNTLKRVDENGFITDTIDRSSVFSIQTPQGFRASVLKAAHDTAEKNSVEVTDDCALCEYMGIKVKVIEGSSVNIKITTQDDLFLAESLVKNTGDYKMRIGSGYDVHRLVCGRRLILGGVEIPYDKGLLGHSDADVLLHAVMDSILGAAALGDIGVHFPDTDDKWLGADSLMLLGEVNKIIAGKGYKVNNIDATLIAQAPKISPFIPHMIENISGALGIPEELVSIKATTTEKLGFCGRGEGIAAESVCTIIPL